MILRGIRKHVAEPNGDARILFDGLDFEMDDGGGSVALTGRSGSGKSTLLRILAGLDLDFDGDYAFADRQLAKSATAMARHRRQNIGIVTQDYGLLGDRDVLRNVRLGARDRRGASQRALECLDLVGVAGLARKRPRHLSGGEAQRVAIARALMNEPPVILADEPTGALDQTTELEILNLFGDLQERGTSLVIATHSDAVAEACGRRVRISDGRLVDGAS